MNESQQTFYYLSVALAIGLLIGVERGWKEREAEAGERIAGIRTYGLIGLLGGSSAVLAGKFGALILGLSIISIIGVLTTVYVVNINRQNNDVGITSLVTGVLTFVFGAIAVMGEIAIAAALAVVTVLLLSYKPLLHRWLSVLEEEELRAGIKLLLISVVMLPILPNQGYGPWQALNPYAIWWMVVLIASISFVGYFAIKITDQRRGIVFISLFGGLVSSTALTLHLSKMSRGRSTLIPVLATGILFACGTMFLRMLLVASVINPNLFKHLLLPAVVMASLTYLPALLYLRSWPKKKRKTESPLHNPLELHSALSFGLLLALVMFLSKMLHNMFGDESVLVLAAVSGIADVDAISISLALMSQHDLALSIAAAGIIIAAAINSLVKGGMAAFIGGLKIGLRVELPLLLGATGGLISVWIGIL